MIKYNFPIDICPFCKKELLPISYGTNNQSYECPERVIIPIPQNQGYHQAVSHYQVEQDTRVGVSVQHIVLYPYILDTFSNDESFENMKVHVVNANKIVYVMTIPQLHLDTAENMLERIRKLVIFS